MGVYSGKRSLNESVDFSSFEESGNILEMLVEAETNDLNMFNAVIGVDFMSAYNEAGLNYLSEAEKEETTKAAKKGVAQKIKEFFVKLYNKIKNFISAFIARLSNLLSNDVRMINDYKEDFLKNTANGYKFKSVVKPTVYLTIYKSLEAGHLGKPISNVKIKDIYTEINGIVNKIEAATDTDKVDDIVKDFKESCSDMDLKLAKLGNFDNREMDWDIKDINEDIINTLKDAKKTINTIKATGAKELADIKQREREMKLDKLEKRDTDDVADLDLAKANAKYKVTVMYGKIKTKMVSMRFNMYSRYIASLRKAFVTAAKKSLDESFNYAIGELSDAYVESCLIL